MKAQININDIVAVELTARGATIYNEYYEQFPREYRPKRKEAGEILRDQFWHLFTIFGPKIHLGCQVPFQDCVINLGET